MDTLQTPLLFHFSLCAIFLALTFHFTGSTVLFGFKAALEMRPDYEGESGMQPWIPVAPGEEP